MKISMDGLRKNLAVAYRKTVDGYRMMDQVTLIEGLRELRSMIAGLMCIYSEDPEDMMTNMTDEVDKLLPKI
jgi:hypothetical protein